MEDTIAQPIDGVDGSTAEMLEQVKLYHTTEPCPRAAGVSSRL